MSNDFGFNNHKTYTNEMLQPLVYIKISRAVLPERANYLSTPKHSYRVQVCISKFVKKNILVGLIEFQMICALTISSVTFKINEIELDKIRK